MKDSSGNNNSSRRDFIKTTAKTVAGMSALPLVGKSMFGAETAKAAAAKPRVALILSKTPVPKPGKAKAAMEAMLDAGIEYVAGGTGKEKFWKNTFSAKDRVAIKVNNFAHKMSPGPDLAEAICDRLAAAGVIPENIVVYEHADGALKRAGYKLNFDGPGYRCYGTDRTGYMDKPIKSGACNALYTKILEQCTALINMPTLKAHNMAGVTIALKNHYGSFDNPRQYHENDCDPFIADINAADIIRTKNRLVVCDAVKVLYAGGPEWSNDWMEDFNGIIVATDPVALDAVGSMIIKKLRKNSGKKQLPYNPKPKQLESAAKNGLGVADMDKIDFKQITV